MLAAYGAETPLAMGRISGLSMRHAAMMTSAAKGAVREVSQFKHG